MGAMHLHETLELISDKCQPQAVPYLTREQAIEALEAIDRLAELGQGEAMDLAFAVGETHDE